MTTAAGLSRPRHEASDSPDPPARFRLALLGGFELGEGARTISVPPGVQRLVAFLALQSHPVPRAYVAGVLWPDTDEAFARASLRSALWRLHRCRPIVVEVGSQELALSAEVSVDVRETRRLASALLEADPDAPVGDVDRHFLEGDLLPGWYDDWVLVAGERLRQQCLHALDRLSAHLSRRGRHAEAVDTALSAVAMEPLRESAHLALIQAHLAEGNRWEAIRQYRLCGDLLRQNLNIEPSPRLQALAAHEFGRTISSDAGRGDAAVTVR